MSKLILKGCLVETCSTSTMWDGIYVDIYDQAVTEPELEITEYVTTSTRTTIRDAKNALVLRRDSPFMIEKCDFDNNYVDVLMEKYNKSISQDRSGNGVNAFSQKNYIRSCSFSKTGTLLAPYTGSYKLAGIRLRDVERVVIGDSSMHSNISANTFSNASYGIMAYNAGFECYNNTFSNILYDVDGASVEEKHKGSCIYSYSASDYNDRKTIIGCKNFNSGAPASHKNIFTSSVNGIVSVGEMNLKVFNNVFGDDEGDLNEAISNTGVWVVSPANKEVYITRENTFYNYNVGVKGFISDPRGKFNVGENLFLGTCSIPSTPQSFQGTAIWVGSKYSFNWIPNVPYVSIFENTIGEPGSDIFQPRLGIFVSLITSALISNNHIYFDHSSVPPYPSLGIWMQGSSQSKISGNTISNQSTSNSLSNLLLGIRLDNNINPCISTNTLNYMGNSIQFLGNHGQVALAENTMNYYDNAISLINADIGVQGLFDPTNNQKRTDDNLFYHNPAGLQPDRVIGTTGLGVPISWYFDNSSPANNQIYNPDINNNIGPQLLVEQGVTPNLAPLECPVITNPVARNLALDSSPVIQQDIMRSIWNISIILQKVGCMKYLKMIRI
ncbi:MAG: hypothetical protein IPM91_22315 [Bacteroidetes bacterium]|nr:hypothetical protein [Bacteroidota bacterium]